MKLIQSYAAALTLTAIRYNAVNHTISDSTRTRIHENLNAINAELLKVLDP